ncbi:hypothetical protein NEHOM01_1696 [Nematocida homosporus]|uniref:uncharacterized protein n=1 Tax=Nematocida homosporus TaxID=1912981 RepID=UPI00222012F6|nr:uncharacterized protein NEHOM01_1696 [Nematocida homosporus]KAI5186776.1 hypothetical protein NEHOM01_1696 [Nematocida homosporus]
MTQVKKLVIINTKGVYVWLCCVLIGISMVLGGTGSKSSTEIAEEEMEPNAMANPTNLSLKPELKKTKEGLIAGLKWFEIVDEKTDYTLTELNTAATNAQFTRWKLKFNSRKASKKSKCLIWLLASSSTQNPIIKSIQSNNIITLIEDTLDVSTHYFPTANGATKNKESASAKALLDLLQDKHPLEIEIHYLVNTDSASCFASQFSTSSALESIPDHRIVYAIEWFVLIREDIDYWRPRLQQIQTKYIDMNLPTIFDESAQELYNKKVEVAGTALVKKLKKDFKINSLPISSECTARNYIDMWNMLGHITWKFNIYANNYDDDMNIACFIYLSPCPATPNRADSEKEPNRPLEIIKSDGLTCISGSITTDPKSHQISLLSALVNIKINFVIEIRWETNTSTAISSAPSASIHPTSEEVLNGSQRTQLRFKWVIEERHFKMFEEVINRFERQYNISIPVRIADQLSLS